MWPNVAHASACGELLRCSKACRAESLLATKQPSKQGGGANDNRKNCHPALKNREFARPWPYRPGRTTFLILLTVKLDPAIDSVGGVDERSTLSTVPLTVVETVTALPLVSFALIVIL